MIIVAVLVYAWAFRLSFYIAMRKTAEDYRYKKMREDWEANGTFSYLVTSFFVVYVLQTVFSLITNSAALYVSIFSQDNDVEWTDYLGILIWIIGFLIEVISDW